MAIKKYKVASDLVTNSDLLTYVSECPRTQSCTPVSRSLMRYLSLKRVWVICDKVPIFTRYNGHTTFIWLTFSRVQMKSCYWKQTLSKLVSTNLTVGLFLCAALNQKLETVITFPSFKQEETLLLRQKSPDSSFNQVDRDNWSTFVAKIRESRQFTLIKLITFCL